MKPHSLCLVLSEASSPAPEAYPPATTWLEIRWDKIGTPPTGWIEALHHSYDKVIYTLRHCGTLSDTARAHCYGAWIAQGVPFVDIDYQEPFLKELLNGWAASPTRLILSRHIWEYSGDLNLLRAELRAMLALRPYICKLAVLCQTAESAAELLSLYREFRPTSTNTPPTDDSAHLLIFAMGAVGGFTRLAAPYLGAPYTYAAYNEGVAPGLLSASLMQEIFNVWDDE